MANEEVKAMVPAPKTQVAITERGVMIRNVDELWQFASMVARSGLAPRGFQRAEQVCVAVAHGMELGLSPMQALQGLMVVKGKVGMYVATQRALIESSPLCEYIRDDSHKLAGVTDWTDDLGVTVMAKRGGKPRVIRRFTVADAKRAGLWGKHGKESGEPSAWVTYPARMLYARPAGFAFTDAFGDILKGIKSIEELRDYPDDRPQSGTTLPPKDLDEVTQLLETGGIGTPDDDGGIATEEEIRAAYAEKEPSNDQAKAGTPGVPADSGEPGHRRATDN